MPSKQNVYVFKSPWKRRGAALFDAAGRAVFFLLKLFQKKPAETGNRFQRILVIRLDHIGDLILTRPALRLLRQAFPEAQIDCLVSADSLRMVESDASVDHWIPWTHHWFSRHRNPAAEKKERSEILHRIQNTHYDLAIDFRGDFRNILFLFQAGIPRRLGYGVTGGGFLLTDERPYDTALHQVELNVRLLSAIGVSGEPELLPLKVIQELFSPAVPERLPKTPRVLVHPGAGYPSKLWPGENFETLILRLHRELGVQVLLLGDSREKERQPFSGASAIPSPNFADLRGKLALHDLPILMNQADLFIGGDSGPAHMAAAQGLPILCLFSGVNDVKVWRPWTEKLRLITKPVPCSPCLSPECPLVHQRCMKEITVDEVFEAAREMLPETRTETA